MRGAGLSLNGVLLPVRFLSSRIDDSGSVEFTQAGMVEQNSRAIFIDSKAILYNYWPLYGEVGGQN